MFDIDVERLDAEGTLRHASALRAVAEQADRALLMSAAHWADLNGVVDVTPTALPGTERLVRLGGEGTPEAAEFAAAELGAELALSPCAASLLMADALDLRHRLPVLWGRICAGEVKPWIGRKVAQGTRHLSAAAVEHVDVTMARWADRLTWGRLSGVLDAAVVAADPAAAQTAADQAREDCGVWVSGSTDHGTKTVFIRAEAPDAIWFDATIDRIADGIAILGDVSTKDARRARAVGIIAHHQQALDLFDKTAEAVAGVADTAPDGDGGEDTAAEIRLGTARRPRRFVDARPSATLYVHLGPEAFTSAAASGDGDTSPDQGWPVARVEGVGPVTVGQAQRWLGHCRVTVRPVLDLAGVAPVDGYEIPDRLREAVHLVGPADVFPYATSTRRGGDIDHTVAYARPISNHAAGAAPSPGDTVPRDSGEPPVQTRIGNLAPMTRFHHRIQTHGRWQVAQPYPGVLVWRSPHGRMYLVDHTGTRRLPRAA
jgi:Domain of unknown function (DUF222)